MSISHGTLLSFTIVNIKNYFAECAYLEYDDQLYNIKNKLDHTCPLSIIFRTRNLSGYKIVPYLRGDSVIEARDFYIRGFNFKISCQRKQGIYLLDRVRRTEFI